MAGEAKPGSVHSGHRARMLETYLAAGIDGLSDVEALELLLGITGSQVSIAHFAHLGGALFGFLMIRHWKRKGSIL